MLTTTNKKTKRREKKRISIEEKAYEIPNTVLKLRSDKKQKRKKDKNIKKERKKR